MSPSSLPNRRSTLRQDLDWKKNLPAWLLLGLLVVSLIPILHIGFYARAAMDDFNFTFYTHPALLNQENVLNAAIATAKNIYTSWQGTFVAVFLMSLNPLLISEEAYWITPVVMLASLVLGTVKLTDTLVRRGLGGSWRETVYVSVPLLLLSIQCVASPHESLYWWNGAIYYTFTYAVMLLYIERLCAWFFTDSSVLSILLPGVLEGIMIGGSNYVSGLFGLLLVGCFLLGSLIFARKKSLVCLILLLSLAIPFVISMLAPGNAVRQNNQFPPMAPLDAILISIEQAWKDCGAWPRWLTVLTFLALIPVLWKLTEKINFSFPLPIVATIFTFLLFASQNCPHFYASSWEGPSRLRNIIFFSFHWLILLNEWYWLGWLRHILRKKIVLTRRAFQICTVVSLIGICVVVPRDIGACALTSAQCVYELQNGIAQAFAKQIDDRTAILSDPNEKNPVLEPLYAYSILLSAGTDILDDPTNWSNIGLAGFYGKDSVTRAPYS